MMTLPESSDDDRTEMFLACFAKAQRSVHVVIRAMLFDRADADEVFQETCLALWRDFHKYSPGTDFGAWARQVARNRVLAYGRRRRTDRHRFSPELAEELLLEAEQADQQSVGREEALEGCLNKLDGDDLKLIRARYGESTSLSDFALRQGVAIESLYKKLAKIRFRLAECIDRTLRTSQHPSSLLPESRPAAGDL